MKIGSGIIMAFPVSGKFQYHGHVKENVRMKE
jgi:hypothetical protein